LHRFNTIQQCDGQTDIQTPRPCLRRAKHSAIVRKKTSNLSKAHVTRDSSGPATLAISVGLQKNNNAS